ncbi:MAG: hypothetical protein OXG08_08430 [Gammaproteobacteria bacterium]|nr:hypothetical protein [Gammaproteobacteria bacterium]
MTYTAKELRQLRKQQPFAPSPDGSRQPVCEVANAMHVMRKLTGIDEPPRTIRNLDRKTQTKAKPKPARR